GGYRRGRLVASMEHFVDEHSGDALGGVDSIVVALDIDHQGFQHLAYASLHLGMQCLHFSIFYERGNVVVGMVTVLGCDQSRADSAGYICCLNELVLFSSRGG